MRLPLRADECSPPPFGGAGRNIGQVRVVLRGMIEDGFAELIAGQRRGGLVTLRKNGWPQLSNVNYPWYPGEQTLQGSTPADPPKTRNTRPDPRVHLHTTRGGLLHYSVVDR